jgi:hypothetical protein
MLNWYLDVLMFFVFHLLLLTTYLDMSSRLPLNSYENILNRLGREQSRARMICAELACIWRSQPSSLCRSCSDITHHSQMAVDIPEVAC